MNANTAQNQLKALLSSPQLPAVLAVISPDEIRAERICLKLEQQFLASGVSPSRVQASELSERKVTALSDSLLTLSLFASPGITYVEAAQETPSHGLKALVALIDRLQSGSHNGCSTLIIRARELSAAHALRKALKGAPVIELEELKGTELVKWVERDLQSAGVSRFGSDVPHALVNLGNESPDQIHRLIEHLALYCEQGEEISSATLGAVFPLQFTPDEYELLGLIVSKRTAAAEIMIQQLLSAGKNPFLLLNLIARNYSTWLALRSLLDKGITPADARARLNLPPWLFNKHLPAVKSRSLQQLKKGIEDLLRADATLKNRSLGTDVVFSELIHSLAA